MAEEEKRTDDIGKFADEVYQQCVDKGWSLADFRLFVQLINLHKESAFLTARQHVDNTLLPSSR